MAPETFDDVRFLAGRLDALEVRPRVFKVIPQHLATSQELVRFLQEEQRQGSEIVLHGFTHERAGAWRPPRRRQLRARLFAPHAAEFLSIPPDEIEARLIAGRSALERAGLEVRGFSAPGWIESDDVRPILRRLGFDFDVGMTQLVNLRNGERLWTDWLGYMGAGGVQERLVGVANRLNRLAAPRFSLLKCFLHPQRARQSADCRKLMAMIPRLLRERVLTTYGALWMQS